LKGPKCRHRRTGSQNRQIDTDAVIDRYGKLAINVAKPVTAAAG